MPTGLKDGMTDMLVRLYDLPPLDAAIEAMRTRGVAVRRTLVPEKPRLVAWVEERFAPWRAEVEAAYARLPPSCFIAVRDNAILGFACHDAIAPNFFGPEGVAAEARAQGIGRALLLATLHAQREMGYAYAIIGGIGPAEFYARTVGAIAIPGSERGIYAGMLR